MKNNIKKYIKDLEGLFARISVTKEGLKTIQLDEAIDSVTKMIIKQASSGKKVIFIGNGASASIASHMSVDFWKNGKIKALAFNDASLLTCISNDYGYRYVFEKPIRMFMEKGDILFAISSSGKSENILNGAKEAKRKGDMVITFSGFDEDNDLRDLGSFNFYVPSSRYGHVEVMHHFICHCILDTIVFKKERSHV